MIDRWQFSMTKMDADNDSDDKGRGKDDGSENAQSNNRSDSADKTAEAIGAVSLNPPLKPLSGPSLLSQQAPSHGTGGNQTKERSSSAHNTISTSVAEASTTDSVQLSTSAMSVDGISRSTMDSTSSDSVLSGQEINAERITVKIADLGNGLCRCLSRKRLNTDC